MSQRVELTVALARIESKRLVNHPMPQPEQSGEKDFPRAKFKTTIIETAKVAMEERETTTTANEVEEDCFQDGSITVDDDPARGPRRDNSPHQDPSKESTLSPIRVRKQGTNNFGEEVEWNDCSFDSDDMPPVPQIIDIVLMDDEDMDNSDVTISSRIKPSNSGSRLLQKQESGRWKSQADTDCKEVSSSPLDQDPICFRRPVPAVLREEHEDGKWAVYPRVAYGKPKTEKAVQPPAGRWAAAEGGHSKKPPGPWFPVNEPRCGNESRWAAQPKQPRKKLPGNASRLPKRQATKDGKNGSVLPCNKPRRHTSKEDDNAEEGAPRRGGRRTKGEEKQKSDSSNPEEKKENNCSDSSNSRVVHRNPSFGEIQYLRPRSDENPES